jgi:ISXO2-like transposase domain
MPESLPTMSTTCVGLNGSTGIAGVVRSFFGSSLIGKGLHKTINHSCEYGHGDIHANTVESAFSLLKSGIVGTWHKVSAKHLPAYLDEIVFRFNNRPNRFLFRDTLIKLILSPNLEYEQLTAKMQDAA